MENAVELCPCSSELSYADCCEPLHTNVKKAETAEALMRSRYSAHVKVIVPYIIDTFHPEIRDRYDEQVIYSWAAYTAWKRLEIVSTEAGGPKDKEGKVEFKAWFLNQQGLLVPHHELSTFTRHEGDWKFSLGEKVALKPVVKEEKIGRNDPCTCGSGKKYKKCCGK